MHTVVVAAVFSALSSLKPADLGPLAPQLRWLETQRLRGTLRHRCNVGPFASEPLSAPGGSSRPVMLRGLHVILLDVRAGEQAAARISARDGADIFPDTVWALFDPAGELRQFGRVPPGRAEVVRLRSSPSGVYRLLINSGPASSNACRITVRARRWAIEALGFGAHQSDPLYYHTVRDFKLAGLNLDMLDFEGLQQEFVTDAGLQQWTARVARWADFSRRFGLRLMPAVNLGGTKWEVQAWEGCRPGVYIKHYDKYPLAPCPLDWRFWEQVYLRRGRAVARLSLKNPWVVGYGLDPEMYRCWHYGHYMLSGTCFCDRCLGGFLKSRNMPPALLSSLKTGDERYRWLTQRGLMPAYYDYLEGEIYKIAVRCRHELHKINPRLLLCVYVLEIGNWFCRGLARGLGTPEVPVIDYAESTYFVGWGKRAERDLAGFSKIGANVLYAGALWYGGYPPAEQNALAAQMFNFAMRAAGYWIWPGNALHTNWSRMPVHRGIPAPLRDYWLALTLANREIERKMASPARYSSPLAVIKPGLVWSSRAKPEEGFQWKPVPFAPVHLAGPATLYFWAPPGVGRIVLRAVAPGSNNGAGVRLIKPDGSLAAQAAGELDEPAELAADGIQGTWRVEVSRADMPLRDVGLALAGAPPYLCSGPDALLRPPPKKGSLVAWWPLDDGHGSVAHDRSGPPALDGHVRNARSADGVRGRCLEFNGRDSMVLIPRYWGLDFLGEFTIAAWVNLRALPERGHGATIVGKGPEAPVQHLWLWIGYPPRYPVILEMGNEKYRYGTSFSSGPLQWQTGRWYHVAVTYRCAGNRATARLYRDGELLAEVTKNEELHSGTYQVSIGAYNASRAHVFDGFIDDVRIYRRALSAEEIRKLAAR